MKKITNVLTEEYNDKEGDDSDGGNMTVQNIDCGCELIKKIMSDEENKNEEVTDYDGNSNDDEKLMTLVVIMIASKNVIAVMKKVKMKRLTLVMVEVTKMKKY
jgi:hypothetical protein